MKCRVSHDHNDPSVESPGGSPGKDPKLDARDAQLELRKIQMLVYTPATITQRMVVVESTLRMRHETSTHMKELKSLIVPLIARRSLLRSNSLQVCSDNTCMNKPTLNT